MKENNYKEKFVEDEIIALYKDRIFNFKWKTIEIIALNLVVGKNLYEAAYRAKYAVGSRGTLGLSDEERQDLSNVHEDLVRLVSYIQDNKYIGRSFVNENKLNFVRANIQDLFCDKPKGLVPSEKLLDVIESYWDKNKKLTVYKVLHYVHRDLVNKANNGNKESFSLLIELSEMLSTFSPVQRGIMRKISNTSEHKDDTESMLQGMADTNIEISNDLLDKIIFYWKCSQYHTIYDAIGITWRVLEAMKKDTPSTYLSKILMEIMSLACALKKEHRDLLSKRIDKRNEGSTVTLMNGYEVNKKEGDVCSNLAKKDTEDLYEKYDLSLVPSHILCRSMSNEEYKELMILLYESINVNVNKLGWLRSALNKAEKLFSMSEFAISLGHGLAKYDGERHEWKTKGFGGDWETFVKAAMRHLLALDKGEKYCGNAVKGYPKGNSHEGAVLFNITVAISEITHNKHKEE